MSELTYNKTNKDTIMTNIKTMASVAVALAMSAASSHAAFTYHLEETFASGATFSGDLTFTESLNNLTAVSGKLDGGGYGTQSINWILDPIANMPTSLGGNFLVNADPADPNVFYTLWISVTWDYSDAPVLTLVGSAVAEYDPPSPYGNNVKFIDGMTSYTLTAVPEPSTMIAGALLLLPIGASTLRMLRKRQAV